MVWAAAWLQYYQEETNVEDMFSNEFGFIRDCLPRL